MQGQLKQYPYPEGVFEKLAARGDELLKRTDWVTTKDQKGFVQKRVAGESGFPPIACGIGTFVDLPIDKCIDTMVVHMKDNCAYWDHTLIEVEGESCDNLESY